MVHENVSNPLREGDMQSRLNFTIFEDLSSAGIVISPNPRDIYTGSTGLPQADLNAGNEEGPDSRQAVS